MEQYDKDWPEFMQGLPLTVVVDNFKELDKIAKNYNKDLAVLTNEKIKQDLNYTRHKINKKWDFETPKKQLDAKNKAAFDRQVENYYRNEAIKEKQEENKEDITKASPKKETKIEKDSSEQSKEEKLAEEKVNAKDITEAAKKDPDPKEDERKEDKEKEQDISKEAQPEEKKNENAPDQEQKRQEELAKFLAEMREAKERNRAHERER